ncbi:MAG: hypothetical protein M1840_000639 [Geoglossum simile]|nr:MAG: hypothetical protein M1840_000639 [Geoglossum simile]
MADIDSSIISGIKPNETQGGEGTPQSKKRKTVKQTGLDTPEATPEPDTARNEADQRRRELELKGKKPETVTRITPEATPEPDNARNEADQRRQELQKQQPPKTPESTPSPERQEKGQTIGNGDGGFAETRSPPPSDEDETPKRNGWSEKEARIVRNTLKTTRGSFQRFGYNGPQDKDKLKSIYDILVKRVHPDNNHHPDAGKALKKLEQTYNKLKRENGINWTDEDEELVKQVLNAPSDSDYAVLGLSEKEDDLVEAVGIELQNATDPVRNKHPDATKAFERVTQAIKNLKKRTNEDTDMEDEEEEEEEEEVEEEEEEEVRGKPTPPAGTSPAKFAAIKYPWATGVTAEGEPIIAHRLKTSLGRAIGFTCVVETQGPKGLVYKFKPGAEIGRIELNRYLELTGIKILAEKDEDGKRLKVWTYKDFEYFEDILWFAIAPLHTATAGMRRKDPETLACVKFRYGLELLSRSELLNVIGKKSTEAHIEKYCGEMDLTPPWAVEPDIIRLTERLVALENKISGFDTLKPGETSLRDILAKLENRMASVEQKLSKVDKIEKASIGLATLVDVLCEKVGLVQTSAAGKK